MFSKEAKSVGDILREDKSFKAFNVKAQEMEVLEKFPEIFPKLKRLVKPKRIFNSVLFLGVENSVLRSELNLNKKNIIEKINSHFAKIVVKDIKFGK